MAEAQKSDTPRWGMAIDLDLCTGCEACVVACHAENNIRIAGDTQASKGRSVNWIRVERYFEGEFPDVRVRFMPVLCQHCDEAPCEPVCPVFATYHTDEGLNAQVYNRCIGTRYCANNCPYTVRFFNFNDPVWPEPLEKAWNPEVSVRSKGVMEKCTFCIQLRDGDVVPACVQSCPTRAMTFGNMSDPSSQVHRLSRNERAVKLMDDLGTRPRVVYLKGLRES